MDAWHISAGVRGTNLVYSDHDIMHQWLGVCCLDPTSSACFHETYAVSSKNPQCLCFRGQMQKLTNNILIRVGTGKNGVTVRCRFTRKASSTMKTVKIYPEPSAASTEDQTIGLQVAHLQSVCPSGLVASFCK